MEVHIYIHREVVHLPCHSNAKFCFLTLRYVQGIPHFLNLQPKQVKPSTQSAMMDPINHLVEQEFCMISACGNPKIFYGGVGFPSKNSCYKGPLLFFPPSVFLLFVFLSTTTAFFVCVSHLQCTGYLVFKQPNLRKRCKALKDST